MRPLLRQILQFFLLLEMTKLLVVPGTSVLWTLAVKEQKLQPLSSVTATGQAGLMDGECFYVEQHTMWEAKLSHLCCPSSSAKASVVISAPCTQCCHRVWSGNGRILAPCSRRVKAWWVHSGTGMQLVLPLWHPALTLLCAVNTEMEFK